MVPPLPGFSSRTSFSGGSAIGEVGVALLDLGRCGVEQLGVERDRLVEVIDVESELYAGHGEPSYVV